MTPTRETQAILDAMAANPMPPAWEVGPVAARQNYVAMRAALGPGEPVTQVENRTIPGPAGEIPIRIYRPNDEPTLPSYVNFHGGGWMLGSIDGDDRSCRSIANRSGCAVVSVEYRLAPEHKYPAAPDDCYAATEWVARHGAEIGVDGSRIAIGGGSAGGNLAAVVAQIARDRGSPAIALQVLNYPVTDFGFDTPSYHENAEGFGLSRRSMEWYWEQYLDDPGQGSEPYASPMRAADLAGLPRALVVTAEHDPLRDEGEAYAQRLQAAGVPVTCTRYDGVIHGFTGQAHAEPKGDAGLTQIAEAVRLALSAGALSDGALSD